jgi:hypothetical protein
MIDCKSARGKCSNNGEVLAMSVLQDFQNLERWEGNEGGEGASENFWMKRTSVFRGKYEVGKSE